MKAKSKWIGIIGSIIIAVCLAIIIVADVLVSKYDSMIMLYFRSTESVSTDLKEEDTLDAAAKQTQLVEEEGAVLLKNNGVLPITGSNKKLNLFGNGSYQTMYQGTGSASSWFKQERNVNVKAGFENAGFEVNPGLWKFYEDNYTDRNDQAGGTVNMTGADASILEPAMSDYQGYSYNGQNILTYSESYSDTAVLIFSRAGGEGSDAKMDMTGVRGGDAGKHYLELQQVEIDLLNYVKENYDKVIILINSATPMELGFIDDEKVDACLWVGMPGTSGANAFGRIFSGAVTPSGHLPDTYAYEVESAPSYYNFGDYSYTNIEVDKANGIYGNYVYYVEGIYVGYRYYETAAADGFIDYDKTVQFPFGYGLSYTTFEWSNAQFKVDGKGGKITASVTVKNTGDTYSGKDVVQLYYHAPYIASEGIEKAEVVLGGFAKTKLLAPGESDTVTIVMDYDDMSSYDYKTEKAYVLSAGEYELSLRTDSHTVKAETGMTHKFELSSKIVYNQANGGRSSDKTAATNLFDDVTKGDGNFNTSKVPLVTRSDWKGTMPTSRDQYANMTVSEASKAIMTNGYAGSTIDINNLDKDHPDAVMPATGKDNGLVISDMIGLDYDDPLWDDLLDQLTVNEMITLFGKCGWHNPAVTSIEKAMAVDMDGAEGLHNLTNDKTANQYTCTPILAATFNVDLATSFGDVFADECLVEGVSGLYAPSMNTHRSPFGGRTFEYYSEDGLLAGKMAAAQINALQAKGIAVYAKHFMLNDQETNRQTILKTWVNEQALREIYARPFELSVKEAKCTGFMCAYNGIGNGWTGVNYNLLNALPRGEWGFTGRMLTDACDQFEIYSPDAAVVAGIDMWLTAAFAKVSSKITSSNYGMQALRRAAHDQLYVFANSAAVGMDVQWNYSWIALVVVVNVVLAAGMVCAGIFMVYPAFFKKKKTD